LKNRVKKKKKLGPLEKDFLTTYHKALNAIGPRHWWPGENSFEVAIGAILTQNTSWKNVEKAINKLKQKNLFSPKKLYKLPEKRLAQYIRSSGYYNMKAKKIKAFLQFLFEGYGGKMANMTKTRMQTLRKQLLSVHGIGPETADSILLYAVEKPSFVVDAYTKRIFSRHDLFSEKIDYESMREVFMENLKPNTKIFNEFHALIVYIGHHYCKKSKPLCEKCPWNWIEFTVRKER